MNELDMFARYFMVKNSKSLINFAQLEEEFYAKYKDLHNNEDYRLAKRANLYKKISYQIIIKNIDLKKEFDKYKGKMKVDQFKHFLDAQLDIERKYDNDILDIINDINPKEGDDDIDYEEIDYRIKDFIVKQ
jgi:hypothetical protein